MRVRNHTHEQPPSLYWSRTAGVTLNSKYPENPNGGENLHAMKKSEDHDRHVIVSSEPSTYREEDWTLIEKNHCLLVGEDGVRIEEFQILVGLNSKITGM